MNAGQIAWFLAAIGLGGPPAQIPIDWLATIPIYSVTTARAHDFASSQERVELSAALMFYFATGRYLRPIWHPC